MEIMRRGRVVLQRRTFPHSSSTSIGGASLANPPPRLARRGSSGARPAPLACATRLRTARPPRPVGPVRSRATPTVHPRPTATSQSAPSVPLQSMDPPPPIYIPGRGLGRRFANVPQASPAFREASQVARQTRFANDRLGQDAPSSTRRRARSSSDDSDSDDQPLARRRRHRAPRPVSGSDPSSVPSPPVAAASSPRHTATPPPIPSWVNDLHTPPDTQAKPPLVHPSTSQQPQGGEADPSDRPPPATS
ncbi:WAS/WASL-interacting protein family member 2-like [Zingiber officinale]|uniref:WAS/WASL-interacting protein family member 2-like n=1 Tax=Zingiber officinale TaxID=94328 RepID=UPI001C4D606B|nr:WAS/WASL-interacting protein family member 2-like [Zingiber officinale]